MANDFEKFSYIRWSNFQPLDFYDRAKRHLSEIDSSLVLAGHGEEASGGHDDHKALFESLPATKTIFYAFFVVHMLTIILDVCAHFLKKRKMFTIAVEWA